jgi:hypothetical protein
VRQVEWHGVQTPLFMYLLDGQNDWMHSEPESWKPTGQDLQLEASGPSQVEHELWQLLQVDPERYFPTGQLRQFEAVVWQVWQEELQGSQLLALRKVPGLHWIGRQAPSTSWVPMGHEVQSDAPAPEHVEQVASQARQAEELR